jgi:hypothetical protein
VIDGLLHHTLRRKQQDEYNWKDEMGMKDRKKP